MIILILSLGIGFYGYKMKQEQLNSDGWIDGKISKLSMGIDLFLSTLIGGLFGVMFKLTVQFLGTIVFFEYLLYIIFIISFYLSLKFLVKRHKVFTKPEDIKNISESVTVYIFLSHLLLQVLLSIFFFFITISSGITGNSQITKDIKSDYVSEYIKDMDEKIAIYEEKLAKNRDINKQNIIQKNKIVEEKIIEDNIQVTESITTSLIKDIPDNKCKSNFDVFDRIKLNRILGKTYTSTEWCNLSKLMIIDNYITSIPKEVGKLKNLTELIIIERKLTSIPKEIWNLPNLTKLMINQSKLNPFPKEVWNLTQLEELDVGMNDISILPKEIGNLINLKKLDISKINLTYIPKEIGKMKKLEELNISLNDKLTTIPKEIGNLSNLIKLDLNLNNLDSLPIKLINLKQLIFLDLSFNDLLEPLDEMYTKGTNKNKTKGNINIKFNDDSAKVEITIID